MSVCLPVCLPCSGGPWQAAVCAREPAAVDTRASSTEAPLFKFEGGSTEWELCWVSVVTACGVATVRGACAAPAPHAAAGAAGRGMR